MDARPRVVALLAVILLSTSALAGAAVSGDEAGSRTNPTAVVQANGTATSGPYPGHTLITLQAWGWFGNNNGSAFIVSPTGERVWEWSPPNSRIFDGEMLRNGNLLFSVGEVVPAANCPDQYDDGKECIRNRVVELDYQTKEVVWQYDWYDVRPHAHEVHDADRLPNGETVIADMGNHRVFVVNQAGKVTWEWRAENHISEGTAFWNEYVPENQEQQFRRKGPESDWTHLNDVDYLGNDTYLISIRNYDTVLAVKRPSGDIVEVYGSPGNHSVMNDQHNPMFLGAGDPKTLLVADSKNNRIVEIDAKTEEQVWVYDGTGSGDRLAWPRDADRLPNGNTLITDSRGDRVIEVNPEGKVVWEWRRTKPKPIIYEADRIFLPQSDRYLAEEPGGTAGIDHQSRQSGTISGLLATANSWLSFWLPAGIGVTEILLAVVAVAAGVVLVRELR